MFGQQNNTDQNNQTEDVVQDENTIITHAGSDDQANWQHPGTPLNDAVTPEEETTTVATDVAPVEAEQSIEPVVAATAPIAPAVSENTTNDLIDIKQQALQQLTPLVGHLEQSPEEKFRTTMMMIQASDDQTLVKAAFEAANAIEDEKVKAQALLDIVNEINYFTAQHPAAQ